MKGLNKFQTEKRPSNQELEVEIEVASFSESISRKHWCLTSQTWDTSTTQTVVCKIHVYTRESIFVHSCHTCINNYILYVMWKHRNFQNIQAPKTYTITIWSLLSLFNTAWYSRRCSVSALISPFQSGLCSPSLSLLKWSMTARTRRWCSSKRT